MVRPVDMSTWDDQHGHSAATARETEFAYVLVADTDVQRTAACVVEAIKAFNVGVLVARDGEEAVGILQRFGPPILLITDLSLPGKDGFAVIEALRDIDRGRAEIIAWSSFRDLREFASNRLAGLSVRILSGSVAPAVLRGAIERALRSGAGATAPPSPSSAPTAEDIHQTMTELSEKARQLCGTAGVAVYLKGARDAQFRASVTWTSEPPIPHSPYHMPRVFDLILETGNALVLPDLASQPLSDVPTSTLQDVVRGLVAVPIVGGDGQIVGTICVFDVKPLTLGEAEVDALKALGRSLAVRPVTPAGRPEKDGQTLHGAERLVSGSDGSAQPLSLDVGTGMLDRRGANLAIARELARVRREQRQLSVILFDVDPVTRTDRDGVAASAHDPIGAVSETLTSAIRGSDLIIRWSREEFLVVLTGLGVTDARHVAERVRAVMQAGVGRRVAVSGGVAELLADEMFDVVVARANENVRVARERGHNRVA